VIASALLALGVLTTAGRGQSPESAWDVLARAAADADTPSTDAERARSPLSLDPARVVYFVRPGDTDPRIDHFLKDHYVMYSRAVTQNGRLFVFLPGTWARPAQYQWLLSEAAEAGYKVVALEYPNDTANPKASAVEQICAQNANLDCSAQVRSVRIWGGAADGVAVSAADGIQNRLERLLEYLARAHPAEGWGAFLVDGRVIWSRVALGGHSQGAGMAAFLAKRFAVSRVALWSGPVDYVPVARRFAPWLSEDGATPRDRWFALVHRDEAWAAMFLGAYAALGVPGAPAVADGSASAGAHVFILTVPPRGAAAPAMPAIANPEHGSVATDVRTPLDAVGRPAYAPVWRAMTGP
jgi:hypothetical protein